MLADKKLLGELIPQREPIIMVDGLVSNSDTVSVSKFKISEDNIFCENGFFTEPGIIENMAQTAALRSGYTAWLSKEKPRVGYIGSLKKLKIYTLPKINDELETSVEVQSELMNAIVIKAETRVNDTLIAEGNMNIFLQ